MPKHLNDKLVNGRYAEAMVDCTLSYAVCNANFAEVRATFHMAERFVQLPEFKHAIYGRPHFGE